MDCPCFKVAFWVSFWQLWASSNVFGAHLLCVIRARLQIRQHCLLLGGVYCIGNHVTVVWHDTAIVICTFEGCLKQEQSILS